MTSTTLDSFDRGFPVTMRLCELPGFARYFEAHRSELPPECRGAFRDWLVAVDAEQLEAGLPFDALFGLFLERSRELEWLPLEAARAA